LRIQGCCEAGAAAGPQEGCGHKHNNKHKCISGKLVMLYKITIHIYIQFATGMT